MTCLLTLSRRYFTTNLKSSGTDGSSLILRSIIRTLHFLRCPKPATSVRQERSRANYLAGLSRTYYASQKVSETFVHTQKQRIPSLPCFFCCQRPFHKCYEDRGLFGGGGSGPQQKLEDIAKSIRERQHKRIIVMAGAGISTPSGIPDFRSPGSGLYDNLQQYDLPYAEAIFEINYFHYNPKPFFALAKELYPGNYQPNLTHYFVRLLHDKGQLLRMYTQNIDGLERMAGIPSKMLVEAHGTFATATCTVCRRDYKGEELRNDIMEGTVPNCPHCKGVIKPDIVFFGEELPQHFFLYLTDFPMADLLIVMGTSLEVEPFASLAGAVRGSVPRLLINRDLVGPFAWGSPRHNDVAELGDVVSGVRKLAEALGWMPELETLMAAETVKNLNRRPREDHLPEFLITPIRCSSTFTTVSTAADSVRSTLALYLHEHLQ